MSGSITRRRPKHSGVGQFIAIILGGVTALGLYYTPPVQRFMHAMRRVIREDQLAEQRPPTDKPIATIIEEIEPSVLRLKVMRPSGEAAGSSFVVGEFCVTNYHVLENALSVQAFDRAGREVGVMGFVALHPDKDLAILRLNERFPGLKLAKAHPGKGDQVLAFGAPRTIAFSVTIGAVNNLVRGIREESPNLTWVVHQAPISPGNSGGPLVNHRGEVVGMNTFFDRHGQNLNFAMSSLDIVRILDELESWETRPISDIPKEKIEVAVEPRPKVQHIPVPQPPPPPPQPQAPWRIELPSGMWLTQEQFEFGPQKIAELFPKDAPKATFHHDNKKVRAMLGHSDHKLNGGMALFDQAGEPHIVGQYKLGRREGVLQVFVNGERVLWREYRNDYKDGVTCLFVEGQPRFVQEFKLEKPQGEFVVEHDAEVRLIPVSDARDTGDRFRSEVEAIEAEIAGTENATKIELAKWSREQEKLAFAKTRADRAKISRATAARHAAEVAAAEAAANEALWRTLMRANTPYRVR